MFPISIGQNLGAASLIRRNYVAPSQDKSTNFTDFLVESGNARNDEFNVGPALDAKWTLVGTTPDVVDVNSTTLGNLYLRRNDTANQLTVYYQALPTLPCNIVLKLTSDNVNANFARGGGLVLLPATPTTASPAMYTGSNWNGNRDSAVIKYSNLGTFSAQHFTGDNVGSGSIWFWVRVRAGGTNADFYHSLDGLAWTLTNMNLALGFTAANIGIGMAPEGQTTDLQSSFEYFRVSA